MKLRKNVSMPSGGGSASGGKDIVVIYHRNCLDGFAGAWAAWKALGDRAEYIPATHQALPDVREFQRKEIYFVDFSYRKEVMDELVRTNRDVIVIDHHKTTENVMPAVSPKSVLDSTHSGSVLAWHYFHSADQVPEVLKYVEDQDLWKWKLPHTEEVATFLATQGFEESRDFTSFDWFAARFEDPEERSRAIAEGAVALRYKESIVRGIVRRADFISFEGREMLSANTCILSSEIGHALYSEHPPMSLTWYERRDGVRVSLRSDGSVDVSDIAQKYGGGGHRAAAAFKVDLYKPLPWRYLERPPAGFSGNIRGDI